ncbi:alkaline phosphatase family protein [Zunongwangia endophytica]|uniref:Alkaline phosphatase family protein n=1 Tax=Zunongwangia endophytica TaxID=1808945 RepID=A0ABV8H6K3_9FLAO|nr:alkaline phosphatase family protein [Zunongwangia endophytica]MDN3594800.1 alkaline phosphatase family protein [Zunongwangia endophytica]
MKTSLKLIAATFILYTQFCQAQQDDKVIVITLDGLRWQELFGGADSTFINNEDFVDNIRGLNNQFWADTPEKRRELLFPFFWNHIAQNGVMLGNRRENNKVNLTNTRVVSFPGYNEILTGKADDTNIKGNDKIYNPNKTFLEIANNTDQFSGKVLAFGSWDVFPFILNEKRSGLPVNAGYRSSLAEDPSAKELFLDKIQKETPKRWGGVRFDVFTNNYAMEALKHQKPDILYIAYGETDDYAHDGRYDHYLTSARRTDDMIKEIWTYISNDNYYKGKTSILITTDHGRGTGTTADNNWKHHGQSIPNSNQTWIAAFGANIKNMGELKEENQYYTAQFAPTVAKILKLEIESDAAILPILK